MLYRSYNVFMMCCVGFKLTLIFSFLGARLERKGNLYRKVPHNMAAEEKPGVKSSTSIVPCFLFVEVSQQPWTWKSLFLDL